MVDITGHVAFGLFFALPAWFFYDERVSVGLLALAAAGALLPDVDIWLAALFPDVVHHHGVTHTVVFVTVASLVGSAVLTGLLGGRINDWVESEQFGESRLFGLAFAGLLAGGLSHVFADILSAPDISTPIEPFWPVVEGSVGIDVIWYDNPWINVGFFTVMLAVHLVLAYVTTPPERRHLLRPV